MQKIRIAAVGILLALVATITSGSIAYFTAQTGTIDNVFTVGNVKVSSDEGKFDSKTGQTNLNSRVITNKFGKLGSGEKVATDTKIYLSSDSTESWVFVTITLTKWKSMGMLYSYRNGGYDVDLGDIENSGQEFIHKLVGLFFTDFNWDDWEVLNMEDIIYNVLYDKPDNLTFVLCSKNPQQGGKTLLLFSGIGIPNNLSVNDLKKVPNLNTGTFKMTITVSAFQSLLTDPEFDSMTLEEIKQWMYGNIIELGGDMDLEGGLSPEG